VRTRLIRHHHQVGGRSARVTNHRVDDVARQFDRADVHIGAIDRPNKLGEVRLHLRVGQRAHNPVRRRSSSATQLQDVKIGAAKTSERDRCCERSLSAWRKRDRMDNQRRFHSFLFLGRAVRSRYGRPPVFRL
jgi:hypothetical protein